jgi:hypothetical protein
MEPELWLLVLLLGDCALASAPELVLPVVLLAPPAWASV